MDIDINKTKDLEDKIISTIDKIADPIKQTMSPMGGNVLYVDNHGNPATTNDGYTIIRNMSFSDPIENLILDTIKTSSSKTNMEAGDGTSSTVLWASILTKGGIRLIREGWNQIAIRNAFNEFGARLKDVINKRSNKVTNDDELLYISRVSSSYDEEIALNTVKTIKIVGTEGQVMINQNYSDKTELEEDSGFITSAGLFAPELGLNNTLKAYYNDVPVLVTDKRLYYKQEAESILKTVIDNGYDSVVIVAADFIGEALPYFIANHKKGIINVCLIKETDVTILTDLATYLGGDVVSDKSGNIVDKIKIDDFLLGKMVFAEQGKSILSRDLKEDNKNLEDLISELQKEIKKNGNKNDSEYRKLESRIASLTRGMVTIKVGGKTQLEIMEKIHKYEDSINAVRRAIEDGYVVGGGLATFWGFENMNKKNIPEDIQKIFKEACQANISQIALNCGHYPPQTLETIYELSEEFSSQSVGYNAAKNKHEDLLEAGVIEPYKVISQVIDNAISIANVIITSRYIFTPEVKKEDK